MQEIVAIGNPVFDIIETPYVKTNGRVLSGCSTNAALTYSKLGKPAYLVGKVGNDFREELITSSSKYGVRAYPLESNETGGFHLIYKDEKMRDRDLFILGIADPIKFEEIPEELLSKDGFVLGPILQEIDKTFVEKLTNYINKEQVILLDPQGIIREYEDGKVYRVRKDWIDEVLSRIHIVKPNEHEAEILFPNMELWKVARKISSMNNYIGIVTLADRGSYVSYGGKTYHVPAFKTIERDPTGCGDVYGGAFIYKYLETADPLEAAVFASAAASFMVETTGPDFKLNLEMVSKRFEKLFDGVKRVD
jgi:sugar/nucleoside kinase (ribokinase family)